MAFGADMSKEDEVSRDDVVHKDLVLLTTTTD
jgi:hypothetical protein